MAKNKVAPFFRTRCLSIRDRKFSKLEGVLATNDVQTIIPVQLNVSQIVSPSENFLKEVLTAATKLRGFKPKPLLDSFPP